MEQELDKICELLSEAHGIAATLSTKATAEDKFVRARVLGELQQSIAGCGTTAVAIKTNPEDN